MKHRITALLAALGLAVHLLAGQFIPLSIAQLAEKADLILHGTVLAKSCQRDATGRIYTRVELQVAEVWKGVLATNRFTIVHGGGVLGEERATVSGQVEYEIGEEVVAFLVLNPRGEGVSLGLAQGKFTVVRDAIAGSMQARNPFHGGGTSATPILRAPLKSAGTNSGPSSLSLADLKRQTTGGTR